MSWNFGDLPEHWKRYYRKFEERGWFNTETGEWIQEKKAEFNKVSALPITIEDYTNLSTNLLKLGIKDRNPQISEVYFELQRRAVWGNSYYIEQSKEDEGTLWDIGMEQHSRASEVSNNKQGSFDERVKVDLPDPVFTRNRLPIEQTEYNQMIKILGNLAINDNVVDENKDRYDKRQSLLFAKLFLNLQARVRKTSQFKTDDELSKIEMNVNSIMKDNERGINS